MGGSSSSRSTSNNYSTIENNVGVEVNLDNDLLAEAIQESNLFFESGNEIEALELLADITANKEKIRIEKQSLVYSRIMLGMSAIGLFFIIKKEVKL